MIAKMYNKGIASRAKRLRNVCDVRAELRCEHPERWDTTTWEGWDVNIQEGESVRRTHEKWSWHRCGAIAMIRIKVRTVNTRGMCKHEGAF